MQKYLAAISLMALLTWWYWPQQQSNQASLAHTPEPQSAAIADTAESAPNVDDWRLPQPLLTEFNRLNEKARQQDPMAQYQLGRNLYFCYYSADNDVAHQQKLDELRQTGDSSASFANNYDRYSYCRGISRADKNRFADLLMQAAVAGHPEAAAEIGTVSAKLYLQATGQDKLERDAYVAARQAYLKHQQTLLENAAQTGHVNAIKLLLRDAMGQRMGEDSTAKALAYLQVLRHLEPEFADRYQWQEQRLLSTASADDISRAEQTALTLLKNATPHPPR
ncbi:hypothetical protein [Bowmanella denitrificans]|uniref:hypothetical protein n=1 Tax=Bowmanella denitrificans TaxID=366582 RepID=UPI000C9A88DE|nr:hypothetical protein [Bowmanella denitrificans]